MDGIKPTPKRKQRKKRREEAEKKEEFFKISKEGGGKPEIKGSTIHNFYNTKRPPENGNQYLCFNRVIWDYDIPEIVKALKENGISEFTISSTFSSLIETLAAFEKEGIRMARLTEVNATYSDWKTGKKARIPAIRMTL